MVSIVAYFGPNECLSNQKCYIHYKTEKPWNLTARQYLGLVRDLNSKMAQMPPLFNDNKQLDVSKIVDSLANKASRTHKAMLISQGFNPETGDISTFAEHY